MTAPEQQPEQKTYEPPAELRLQHFQQQVANLSVQVTDLSSRLDFANQVIAAQQAQLEQMQADVTGEPPAEPAKEGEVLAPSA